MEATLIHLGTADQCTRNGHKQMNIVAVFVTQLVEQSLPIPEFRGSNPFILPFTVNCIEKTKR